MTYNPDPQYQAWGYVPRPKKPATVPVMACGRVLQIVPALVPAVTEFVNAMIDTDYEDPTDWIGTYKYRVVAGTNQLSRHAYDPGMALDWDYGGDVDGDGDPTIDKNPHLHRPVVAADYGKNIQLLRHQVDAVLSITTVSGKRVWRWLGDSNGDSMHFDINCPKVDLESGIVPYGTVADPDTYRNVLNVGSAVWRRDAVDWAIAVGLLINEDEFIDDFNNNLEDGRFWALMRRYDAYREKRLGDEL